MIGSVMLKRFTRAVKVEQLRAAGCT